MGGLRLARGSHAGVFGDSSLVRLVGLSAPTHPPPSTTYCITPALRVHNFDIFARPRRDVTGSPMYRAGAVVGRAAMCGRGDASLLCRPCVSSLCRARVCPI